MPRRARIALPGVPLHLVQRGINRQACFFCDEDRAGYLRWMGDCAIEAGCSVHAYVLMNNHVHLLVTPATADAVGAMMKRLGQRYVQYVNRTYGRSGTLWEGRFRSCPVQDDHHLLACYRYIELNPVRAGIVRHPAEYPWSSYRANAEGRDSRYLVPHPCYLALGADPAGRASAYRDLVVERLPSALLEDIRTSIGGNYALGDAGFKRRLEAEIGRPAERGHAGRPSKRARAEGRDAAAARAPNQLRPA